MRYQTIDFPTFREKFINHAKGGFYPVHSSIATDELDRPLKVVQMDMICEWRLADGKVRFVEVPYETDDEFNAIVQYLKDCAGHLNATILERIDKLKP
jgi:hypothetical protein